uniref:DUF5071 domain-containing protein n=1 Tax=Thaumasiovibrio occultus TaxID=1891184 RepID=UPI000B35B9D0|nr:DUF5071 domain-containing protein [Thaumasiovibrio occultus]
MSISNKCDDRAVEDIIAQGYPANSNRLDELLEWTCDPNWPIAGKIYDYFIALGQKEVQRVLHVASKADMDWRYSLITQIIAHYDDNTLKSCTAHLQQWAKLTSSESCDIESIRILTAKALIPAEEIAEIARRNLFVYNVHIRETLEAAEQAIYSLPLRDHTL